jgi:hypothetical protein
MLLLLRGSRLNPLIAARVGVMIAIVVVRPLASGGRRGLSAIVVLVPGILRGRTAAWSLILTAASC